jgi:hypothetical protein
MASADIALLVTAIGGATAAIITAIAALRNSNYNAARVAEAAAAIDALERKLEQAAVEAERQAIANRNSIIYIGEDLSRNRADNAKLALLVNQLFNQFKEATGKSPDIDLEMLRHLQTLSYITGPLGPLDTEAVRRVQ